jgi:hypothetical protein
MPGWEAWIIQAGRQSAAGGARNHTLLLTTRSSVQTLQGISTSQQSSEETLQGLSGSLQSAAQPITNSHRQLPPASRLLQRTCVLQGSARPGVHPQRLGRPRRAHRAHYQRPRREGPLGGRHGARHGRAGAGAGAGIGAGIAAGGGRAQYFSVCGAGTATAAAPASSWLQGLHCRGA